MRDTLPAEVKTRRRLLEAIIETYESFGFDQIETPMVEELERLVDSDAGENDKLIFKVLRRGIDWSAPPTDDASAADLGLRYDLTVPLARYFATNEASLPAPFKAIQTGPVFRAERPQKGRYRQFTQCDIDVIGSDAVHTEIELVSATAEALTKCGLDGFLFRINDRRVLDALMNRSGVAAEHKAGVLIALDKLDKLGEQGVRAELDSIASGYGDALFGSMKSFDLSWPEASDVATIVETLSAAGVATEVDITLVRGMGYYTGPIFEIHHPGLGMSIGGGGRYDGMVQRLSGIDAPACGISIGFERLCLLLEGVSTDDGRRVALLWDKSLVPADVLSATQQLRGQGYSVRAERAVKNRKAQLARLGAAGFTHFASIPGDLEVKPLGGGEQ